MTAVERAGVRVDAPVRRSSRRGGSSGADAPHAPHASLERALRDAVDGEVRFDAGSRAAYSTDASNYRQVPIGVVVPRTIDAAVAAVAVCHEHRAPVLSRGGGTSLGGQCTNTAVVIDWSKYCNRLVSVDAERRTCVVEPGIVLDHLNAALRDTGLEFGPRPATHDHCTIGGMIGNNSCGSTAQRTGKVVDNVVRLEVLLYDGTRMWVGPTSEDECARILAAGGRRAEVYARLRAIAERHGDEIRRRFPDIPRRVSGYNLDSLLPELGFDVARALVGSEGTLVTVLQAELRLVPRLVATTMVVLGYPDLYASADAVPDVVASQPAALEGLDDELIRFERTRRMDPKALHLLPKGEAWLMVQFGGEDTAAAEDAASRMLAGIGRTLEDDDVARFSDREQQEELWEVRESALGATARIPGGRDTWPGWEDSAVDPSQLGAYLRDLDRLLAEYDYADTSVYGHFGQGCVHMSVPFDLVTAEGVARFRSFVERAADLVVSHGGSLSGEHGDGQARGELLTRMFGAEVVGAFAEMKEVFDPDDRMNPGKVVAPRPLDADLRLGADYNHGHAQGPGGLHFAYPADDGDFGRAVLRCVGVGKCRHESGGVMCPSYMVTREEEHSTRGRARLLFEMLDGGARDGPVRDAWRSDAVRDALDLCLACKGCKSDCPVNVDMATYKVEFLAHHYAGRVRPRAHYSMGWLPLVAAAASALPRTTNALVHSSLLANAAKRVAGVDRRREVPWFAHETLQSWFARRRAVQGSTPARGRRGTVLLWPDTFTNRFHPAIGRAAVEVLEDAGWDVTMPATTVCCGLTWISTGQLDTAVRVLRRTSAILRDHVRAGGLVVGLEPSCTTVLRSDACELLPADLDLRRVRDRTVTLAELLHDRTPGWVPPRIERRVVVQTHCHQHAVLHAGADAALLRDAGADLAVLDSGCCGLAGNFGFEAGHHDVSVACAERVLLPALRACSPDDVVLADGFSCRTQIHQCDSGGREAMHLAELLHAAARTDDLGPWPERAWSERPERHGAARRR